MPRSAENRVDQEQTARIERWGWPLYSYPERQSDNHISFLKFKWATVAETLSDWNIRSLPGTGSLMGFTWKDFVTIQVSNLAKEMEPVRYPVMPAKIKSARVFSIIISTGLIFYKEFSICAVDDCLGTILQAAGIIDRRYSRD